MLVNRGDIESVVSELSKDTYFGLDTETTGLSESDYPFLLIIYTQSGKCFQFNMHEYAGLDSKYVLDHKDLAYLCDFLHNHAHTFFIHNAKFDMRMLSKIGLTIADVHCTYAVERVLKNNYLTYSLDSLANRYCPDTPKDDSVKDYITKHKLFTWIDIPGKKKREKRLHFEKVPLEIMLPYSKRDAELTLKIGLKQLDILNESDKSGLPSLMPLYRNEVRLTTTCFNMERRGVMIDKAYTAKAMLFETDLLNEAINKFQTIYSREFVDSNKIFEEIFSKEGVEVRRTEKGNPSFTADNLELIDHPTARLIETIRHHEKMVGTYYSSFLHLLGGDGRLRATINQAGTESGRFSYMNPNLQNIPKQDEDGLEFYVRKCFIPTPGFTLYSIDYQQQEFRLMLDYAGDKKLIHAINNGADVHQATADMIGISRKQAKAVNFACIAKDSLVLTDKGLVPIQNVSVDMLVWDGLEFVQHDGVIFKGIKEVIEYSGIRATPCHKVFTESHGKVTFAKAKQKKLRILKTEYKGNARRVPDNYEQLLSSTEVRETTSRSGGRSLRGVWKRYVSIYRKHCQSKNNYVYVSTCPKIWNKTKQSCSNAIEEIRFNGAEMQQSVMLFLQKLWRAWNRATNVSLGVNWFCPCTLHFRGIEGSSNRPHRQPWSLRNWKYSIHYATNKRVEHTKNEILEEETYDILNAGPRNRFTVDGHLVSNCLYGAGIDKLAKMIGTTPQEARDIKLDYFGKLPLVERFIRSVTKTGEARGFIYNWMGRRCYIEKKEWAYILPNHLIQGSGADVIKDAMNSIDHFLKPYESRMVLQVHDELVFEIKKGEEEIVEPIKKIMEDVYQPRNGMKLTCSTEFSTVSWGHPDKGV